MVSWVNLCGEFAWIQRENKNWKRVSWKVKFDRKSDFQLPKALRSIASWSACGWAPNLLVRTRVSSYLLRNCKSFLFLVFVKRRICLQMNLYSYLSTVNRLWSNEDGTGVARFLTISGNHAANTNLHVENPESAVERSIPAPLDEVVSAHIKVLYYLHDNRNTN